MPPFRPKAPGSSQYADVQHWGLSDMTGWLPERQTRRENAYAWWRSTARVSTDIDSKSKTARKPGSRHRDDAGQTYPARPKTRRRKSSVPDGVQD